MAGWLERRCAANSLGVEVDFIEVRLCCVRLLSCPSIFWGVFVSSAIPVALRGSEISELPLTHSDTAECFEITPPRPLSQEDVLLSFQDSVALSPSHCLCAARFLFICFFYPTIGPSHGGFTSLLSTAASIFF